MWRSYFNRFSAAGMWRAFFVLSCLVMGYFVLNTQIDEYWINPIASKFPVGNKYVNLLFIILLSYSVFRVVRIRQNDLAPTLNGVLLLFIGMVYYGLIRSDSRYIFYKFHLSGDFSVAYSDLLFILLVPIWIPCARYAGPLTPADSGRSILSDDPDPQTAPDITGYRGFIDLIANRINNTASGTSIGVGIFAPWGTGKTHFLLSLKEALVRESRNQVFLFNPWRAGNVDGMVEDFFVTLSKALKPFNKSVAHDIRIYSKKLFGTGKDFASRAVDTLVDEFIPDDSMDDKFQIITRGIEESGQRFIFLVDDLDRMTGEEIMQVIKIVRNSANFGNVFFVVTLDLAYTLAAIKSTNAFSKEEEYLRKIFQLTITLPPIRREGLGDELRRLLVPERMDTVSGEEDVAFYGEVEKVINELRHKDYRAVMVGAPDARSHLESMLDNYRDLKRFTNAFSISSEITKGEINVSDLFILELIKVRSVTVYQGLSSRHLLDYEGEDAHFKIKDGELKSLCTNNGIEGQEQIKKLLDRLFEYNEVKGSRQISRREIFYLYFNYQLFGLISLREFRMTLEKTWQKISDQFMQWWSGGRRLDLEDILDGFRDYADKEQFRKLLKVYIKNSSERNFRIRATNMLYNVTADNFTVCFGDSTTYTAFVKEVFNDVDLPLYYRARLAKDLVEPGASHLTEVLMDNDEVLALIVSQFEQYLVGLEGYGPEVIDFFYLNIVSVDGRGHAIPKAARDLRSYLRSSPSNFNGFLNYLVRSYMLPNNGTFTFEPFVRDIFGTWEEFDQDLLSHQPIGEDVRKIYKIIVKYKDFARNGEKFFTPDSEEREMILRHLEKTGQYDSR
jgi:hypothetical protein